MRATRRNLLLVDTNLLFLLLVGSVALEQVERFKRTRRYTPTDYALLVAFAGRFTQLVATPNVLTEVCNLLGQLGEPLRSEALVAMSVLVRTEIQERLFPSREVVQEPNFVALGLADSSIVLAADAPVTVLTDDLGLYHRMSAQHPYVVNFNHVRAESWR